MFSVDWGLAVYTWFTMLLIAALPLTFVIWMIRVVVGIRTDVRAMRAMMEKEHEGEPW